MAKSWVRKLDRAAVERAARMYNTSTAAAQALGVSQVGFARACKRFGIEPPAHRRKKPIKPRWRYRLNPPVLAQASEMHDTNVEAAAALGVSVGGFAKACKRHGIESPAERKKRIDKATMPSWMVSSLQRRAALLSQHERSRT